MIDYFFSGAEYIRVTRGDTGPGTVDPGYPKSISVWGWGEFGKHGIDAALYSGSKCYFFEGNQYIRVTRGVEGAGSVDPGYPKSISVWGWGEFGANGIDAALWSGTKCYFFAGDHYIRVTRGDTGAGTVDSGYPRPISVWDWAEFGSSGIDGALYSGSRCYFFSGRDYVRVSRSEVGAGLLNAGYPLPITSHWSWGEFGANGIDAALYSGGPLVAPPSGGLVSNDNYFLADNGNDLTDVSATIMIDTDVASTANGWSVQLNAYSEQSSKVTTDAQQFVIYASPGDTQLWARIDNWDFPDEIIRADQALVNLPSPTLKAGYEFKIVLHNDGQGNITGATYYAWDETGSLLGETTIEIVGQTLRTTGQAATAANLAPIVAFTFDIGGDYGGSTATFSEGNGTVTYSAAQSLTALSSEPSYCTFDGGTVENGNIAFGPLPQVASSTVTQAFVTTAETQAKVMAPGQGHALPAPDHVAVA
jgi:hypothetical protein